MNFKEYLEQSEKTISNQFNIDTEREQKVLHAIIGMLTEVEEIMDSKDIVNLKEEISDIFWYSAIIYREYEIDFTYEYVKTEKNIIEFLKRNITLLDMFKKKIFYNKEIDSVKFVSLFKETMNYIISLCADNNFDIEEIFELNIQKLKKRYGNKFSSESAINRDLEGERKVMEENEIILQVIELTEYGVSVFNEIDKFELWMKKPNKELNNDIPENYLNSIEGIEKIKNLLNKIEHGIFI